MRLNKVQKKFSDLMLDQPDALEAPPGDFAALFAAGKIPLSERLKVYRNNIVGSLTEAMRMTFPAVQDLVGKDFFDRMARSFILSSPPHEGNINLYGAGFDAFIKTYQPAKGLPYLADVAKLEIAVNESHFAPDDEPLTADGLAAVAPEDLKLVPRASLRLVAMEYPAAKIRAYCLGGDKSEALDISGGSERVMIFRPQFDVITVRMTIEEFKFMKLLQQGHNPGEALEKLFQQHRNFDFQAFLQRHIALESFAAQ